MLNSHQNYQDMKQNALWCWNCKPIISFEHAAQTLIELKQVLSRIGLVELNTEQTSISAAIDSVIDVIMPQSTEREDEKSGFDTMRSNTRKAISKLGNIFNTRRF